MSLLNSNDPRDVADVVEVASKLSEFYQRRLAAIEAQVFQRLDHPTAIHLEQSFDVMFEAVRSWPNEVRASVYYLLKHLFAQAELLKRAAKSDAEGLHAFQQLMAKLDDNEPLHPGIRARALYLRAQRRFEQHEDELASADLLQAETLDYGPAAFAVFERSEQGRFSPALPAARCGAYLLEAVRLDYLPAHKRLVEIFDEPALAAKYSLAMPPEQVALHHHLGNSSSQRFSLKS